MRPGYQDLCKYFVAQCEQVKSECKPDGVGNKDGFELLGFYYHSITDPVRKRALVAVARALAEEDVDSQAG